MTLERNVHGLESHVRWVKQDARALRGIRRGWGTVNRKTFAHASHPSFLPSFLPGNDNTVTHIYLGDCNAQLIPRQCGHQPIRIVSASQSDRTSLQKIARVNSVGARTTWTHADLQSTLGTPWTGARRGWCLRIEMGSALLREALNSSGQANRLSESSRRFSACALHI